MVRYAFDLYPRTDPRDGTVIRRFEHLQEASYRAEENGTGSGQIKVAGDSPDGEDIDPRGLQYVRVLEIDDSDVETVKGGFWLEQGKFQALTRKETKHLEFGGAGTLAYLQRAVMWSRTYIHDVFTGQDPIGTTWDLANQSTAYANGNHLGAMLWRVIYEAQHFQSGDYTHRHFDFGDTGETHTGTHDDDRTESAIPDLVMTFDQNEDSDGNPWTLTAGTFTAQVGESVLSVARRLMELGLKVEMDPDTFELNAWESPHRTDRTSTTWASGKVLFTAPTAQDIDTGNILSDTIRTIRAFIQRSIVLAGSDNVYAISEGATDIPWEGGYRFDTEDTDTAGDVAARQRLARSDAVDNLKVVMKLGNAPLEGRYRPWVHVNPGDLVTVDTGSDQWEFDNTTFPVAALTVELKQGGDWRAIAELGSSFTSLLEPAFQVGGAPAHTHPPSPQLCVPSLPAVPGGGSSCWDGQDGAHTEVIPAFMSQPEITTAAWENPASGPNVGDYYWRFSLSGDYGYFPDKAGAGAAWYALAPAAPGDMITVEFVASVDAGTNKKLYIQWLSGDYDGTDTGWVVEAEEEFAFTEGTIAGPEHTHTFGPAPAGTVAYRFANNASPWNLHSICVSDTSGGTPAFPGDGPARLVGSGQRAARCDHNHDAEELLTEEFNTALVLKPDGEGGVVWGTDEQGGVTEITDLPTAETDTALVLKPDGAGGVEWGTDDTGSGTGTYEGYVPLVMPVIHPSGNAAAAGVANTAYMMPINIPGPMKLRGFRIRFTNSGSGTFQLGLFKMDTVTAATKVAGGTGSSPGTGWQTIAVSGAPVDVDPGSYVIIFHNAASNTSQIGSSDYTAGMGNKSQASYTWDDTPNLTSGWSAYQNALWIGLIGDMDASGNQW